MDRKSTAPGCQELATLPDASGESGGSLSADCRQLVPLPEPSSREQGKSYMTNCSCMIMFLALRLKNYDLYNRIIKGLRDTDERLEQYKRIPTVNAYEKPPWDLYKELTESAGARQGMAVIFFTPRTRRSGMRPVRTAAGGTWRSSRKFDIHENRALIGLKTLLKYHWSGTKEAKVTPPSLIDWSLQSPKKRKRDQDDSLSGQGVGSELAEVQYSSDNVMSNQETSSTLKTATEWIMYEYTLLPNGSNFQELVLCRLKRSHQGKSWEELEKEDLPSKQSRQGHVVSKQQSQHYPVWTPGVSESRTAEKQTAAPSAGTTARHAPAPPSHLSTMQQEPDYGVRPADLTRRRKLKTMGNITSRYSADPPRIMYPREEEIDKENFFTIYTSRGSLELQITSDDLLQVVRPA